MKAIVIEEYGGPEQCHYLEQKKPKPSPDEVLLAMRLTSVNFADTKMRASLYRNKNTPFTPGFDGVGVIEELGENVKGLQVGQRVAAYVSTGSYAEYACAKEALCYPLSEQVSDENAAGIGIAITAFNALTRAGRLNPLDNVLIHAAAGGVGSTAVQLAKAIGCKQIIAVASTEEKCAFARSIGADHSLCYSQTHFIESVKQLTQTQGADLILDTVGGEIFEQNLQCLANFGRLVIFGHSSSQSGHFESKPLHRHNRSVIGYSSGGLRKKNPMLLQPAAKAVLELFEQNKLKIQIAERFDLSEAAKAHEMIETRQHKGKILLQIAKGS